MSKRTTISNSISWMRFIWGFLAFIFFTNVFNAEGRETNLILFLIFTVLTFLFWRIRRVRFDDQYIYRIYGKKEKPVAFTAIKRIERSGATRNSRRMWRLRYENEEGKEAKYLFIDGIFRHGSVKELIQAVRKINPALEVEESHIWNQIEQQRRRRKRRKERKESKRSL